MRPKYKATWIDFAAGHGFWQRVRSGEEKRKMKPASGGRLELNQLRYLQFFFRKQMFDESHCQIKNWKYTRLYYHIASQITYLLLPSKTSIMATGNKQLALLTFPFFSKAHWNQACDPSRLLSSNRGLEKTPCVIVWVHQHSRDLAKL